MERELDESGAIEEGRPSEPDANVEAPPRAFAPATPFADTKPFAGSLIDPTDPRQPEDAPRLTDEPDDIPSGGNEQ